MKQYDSFIFDSYAFDAEEGTVELCYSLEDEVQFTETLKFPTGGMQLRNLSEELLDRALFALHLIGGVSYFKTCCPKTIEIHSGKLTQAQAEFWNEVYESGLGEFFYRNSIDFRGLVNFPAEAKEPLNPLPFSPLPEERVLIPIGGGKDSIVTLELCKEARIPSTLLRIGDHPLIQNLARTADVPLMTIERTLSPNLFDLNLQGALNGHVPITAYISCLSFVSALLYGFRAVIMSNERSASAGSLLYYGKEINHQWSKSLAFERMFQQYLASFLTPDLQYFSLLRPLSELAIAQLFSEYPKYFPCTTSCNTNWKILPQERGGAMKSSSEARCTSWCGMCPKCTFAFALYAASLPKEDVLRIFGKNLFEDSALIPLYRKLLALEGFKPFECVGTPEETQAAFLMARERGEFNDTLIMQMFFREALPHTRDSQELIRTVLTPSVEHAIPPTFSTVLPSTTPAYAHS